MPRTLRQDRELLAAKPLRLTLADAAALLRVHYQTVRKLVNRELFTVIAPSGRGRRCPVYLHPDEVEVYATQGELALRELRVRKGRLKPRT